MRIITANDLNDFLHSLCGTGELGVDRVTAGDGGTVIRKAGTCWMPYLETIQEAYSQGVNVLVTHEPLYYCHWDKDLPDNEYNEVYQNTGGENARRCYLEMIERKKAWIEEHRMVIIRCHDVLDILESNGIADTFGKLLGLSNNEVVVPNPYLRIYKIKECTAEEFALGTAIRLKAAGQPGLAFYGNRNRMIKTVGIGTGCYSNPVELMEYGAQLCISINDTVKTWVQGAYAKDSGFPLLVIDHGTAEERGVQSLNKIIQDKLECECIHFSQGCGFEWIYTEKGDA